MTEDTKDAPQFALAGFEKKHLRGLAHSMKALIQVGSAGVSDSVITEVVAALEAHELIKVRLHEPDDKKGLAADLAERSKSQLCGLVGHTVILYRAKEEDPVIKLPAKKARDQQWRKSAQKTRGF